MGQESGAITKVVGVVITMDGPDVKYFKITICKDSKTNDLHG